MQACVTDTTSGLNLEESLLCNNNCIPRCHCPAFSCVVSIELRLVVSLESKSGRRHVSKLSSQTSKWIQMGCSVHEKKANCESNHKRKSFKITSNYSALLHPLMTFKRRVSRSLFEAPIDENNINEENHCELLIRLLRALLHTTLLVWLMLCAVEYSAKAAFLMRRKGATALHIDAAFTGTTIWTD